MTHDTTTTDTIARTVPALSCVVYRAEDRSWTSVVRQDGHGPHYGSYHRTAGDAVDQIAATYRDTHSVPPIACSDWNEDKPGAQYSCTVEPRSTDE